MTFSNLRGDADPQAPCRPYVGMPGCNTSPAGGGSAVRGQDQEQPLGRGRSGEDEALPMVAAERLQPMMLHFGLDPRAQDVLAQAAADADGGPDQGLAPGIAKQLAHQRTIDLELPYRQPAQVA